MIYRVLLIMALCTSNAWAETGNMTTVESIFSPVSAGKPFVTFGVNGLPNCYDQRGAFLPTTDVEASSRIYAGLLAAMYSGKKVQAKYTVDTTETGWGRCDITHISFTTN